MKHTTARLAFTLVLAWLAAAGVHAQSPSPDSAAPVSAAPVSATTAAPYFVEQSMNVFRRFSGDGVKTLEFYGQVLGFGDVGAVGGVSRYQVGPSQLKFTRAGANATFTRGGINDAAGVRLWTMWFADEEMLTKRFAAHGLAAPAFKTVDGVRSALVTDPDGEWVQLVIAPNAPADTYGQLEIGIAANDLEKSRAFYRTFVGLEELPPVKDSVLGVTKYPFRHGSTTISLWATPGPKPMNRQLAGIQYVVKPVDPIWALAQERGIPVEQPLRETLPGLMTTWLYDPDQVTNYFAEIRPRQRPSPAQAPAR
jgi:catechol 2,3-dioxygenase-like lactoylglutathione lyase family enzyme/predicted enzyme related to lactoylglutathione lyase